MSIYGLLVSLFDRFYFNREIFTEQISKTIKENTKL
jgi:hypothetical protein